MSVMGMSVSYKFTWKPYENTAQLYSSIGGLEMRPINPNVEQRIDDLSLEACKKAKGKWIAEEYEVQAFEIQYTNRPWLWKAQVKPIGSDRPSNSTAMRYQMSEHNAVDALQRLVTYWQ